jgi:hypothetical protein
MSYTIEAKVLEAFELPGSAHKTYWFALVEVKIPGALKNSTEDTTLYIAGNVRWNYSKKQVHNEQGWFQYSGDTVWVHTQFQDVYDDHTIRNVIMDTISTYLKGVYDAKYHTSEN